MTKNIKVLSGLVLATVLSTGLYASCDKNQKHNGMKNQKSSHMNKSYHKKGKRSPVLVLVKQLNLTDAQKTKVKEIMKEQRQNKQTLNSTFTKTSFDKEQFIKIMSEKRENMIKSKANMIEKVYAVLDSKQKEQFKTLLDLKAEKMQKRMN